MEKSKIALLVDLHKMQPNISLSNLMVITLNAKERDVNNCSFCDKPIPADRYSCGCPPSSEIRQFKEGERG